MTARAGEFARIARLAKRFGAPPPPARGIGDDCAVLPPSDATTVITVDASVEGVHFARELIALDQAAERATEAAMSDVAAMGASVRIAPGRSAGILCALTVPRDTSEEDFDALIEGVARAAERAGAVVLGGNLASGPAVSLTTTVLGWTVGRAIGRDGGRAGERVYCTGSPGSAALGLRALRAGLGDAARFARFVRAWRAPRARLDEGCAMARFASAAIDVSDGVAQDAGHLARASGCAVVLDADALVVDDEQRDAARALGEDAVELALHGGEDYELLFASAQDACSADWRAVGELVEGEPGAVFVRRDGVVRAVAATGWDHFAG